MFKNLFFATAGIASVVVIVREYKQKKQYNSPEARMDRALKLEKDAWDKYMAEMATSN